MVRWVFAALALALSACATTSSSAPTAPQYDAIIRNGLVYDGTGSEGIREDVAIKDGKIAALGDLSAAHAVTEIDAHGQAVAPGFINLLSQAMETLLVDGRSESDIRQGVTLEVFGEGDT